MAIALTGLRVWDGRADDASRAPLTLRIEGDRIAACGSAPELGNDAETIALDGATAIPGLIDAHVHITLDPEIGPPATQLSVDPDTLARAMRSRALAMVRAGITTARDLGGGRWLELDLRNRIEAGEIPGPRLLCAGQPVTTPAGHCHFWGGGARDLAEIRSVVARQSERGANWIKVMATGGLMTAGSRAHEAQFDAAELRAAVEEAARAGLAVAAHCHGTAGIRNATLGGVRTLEHCSWAGAGGFGSDLDRGVLAQMAARGASISATVNAGWGRRLRKHGRTTPFAARMGACFRAAREAGVPLLASTDAGIPGVHHHQLAEALEVFAEVAGLTPLETLRAATSESARALELDAETGRLAPGLAADVLILDGDPLRDLRALRRPRLVLARGRPPPANPG